MNLLEESVINDNTECEPRNLLFGKSEAAFWVILLYGPHLLLDINHYCGS